MVEESNKIEEEVAEGKEALEGESKEAMEEEEEEEEDDEEEEEEEGEEERDDEEGEEEEEENEVTMEGEVTIPLTTSSSATIETPVSLGGIFVTSDLTTVTTSLSNHMSLHPDNKTSSLEEDWEIIQVNRNYLLLDH